MEDARAWVQNWEGFAALADVFSIVGIISTFQLRLVGEHWPFVTSLAASNWCTIRIYKKLLINGLDAKSSLQFLRHYYFANKPKSRTRTKNTREITIQNRQSLVIMKPEPQSCAAPPGGQCACHNCRARWDASIQYDEGTVVEQLSIKRSALRVRPAVRSGTSSIRQRARDRLPVERSVQK